MGKSYLSSAVFIKIIFVWILAINLYGENCEYRVFNINVLEEVPPLEIINQLSDTCGFSVVVKDRVASKMLKENLNGINIKNLGLHDIFELLLTDNELFYTFENNILRISALQTKTFKIDYIVSKRTGSTVTDASAGSSDPSKSNSDVNKISSDESFDIWQDISKEITAILNNGENRYKARPPIVNKNAGLITVTGTKQQLEKVSNYINTMQSRLHKQVLIEVKIISVSLDNSHKSGIDWSNFGLKVNNGNLGPSYSNTYSSIGVAASNNQHYNLAWNNALNLTNSISFTLDGLFNFLDQQGESKVVSSPKILTLNNQQALISVGSNVNYRLEEKSTKETTTDISYTQESIFIGILLNILPEISDDGDIMLRINPTISGFKYAEDNAKQAKAREIAPDTEEKKLSTVVRIKDGETIILGGLITSRDGLEEKGVPVLRYIPILGKLFEHSNKTEINEELIFVITPRIIEGSYNHDATLRSLGYSKKAIISE